MDCFETVYIQVTETHWNKYGVQSQKAVPAYFSGKQLDTVFQLCRTVYSWFEQFDKWFLYVTFICSYGELKKEGFHCVPMIRIFWFFGMY